MSFTINRRTILAAAAITIAGCMPAVAQDYPTKPVTIIVGYAAGGGTDVSIRAMAGPLAEILNERVLVQNVGGAGGGVAAVRVAGAKPDGYTLLATTSSTFSLEPLVQQTVYSDSDFTHIATVVQFQGAIFAPASAPFDNYAEMIAYLKETGRPLKHANYFQLDRLLMDYIARKEGIQVDFVPVQGGNGAVQAILSESVDTAYSGGSWSPHTQSGEAKPIFATSYERLVFAPDLEAMKDLGYDIGTTNYITISAPAGTPEDVVNKLSDALKQVTADEAMTKMGEQRFMEVGHWGPQETVDLINFEIESFREMFDATR
jgi:tripartite-type tricarboxylate transporter receptor subunit TctC